MKKRLHWYILSIGTILTLLVGCNGNDLDDIADDEFSVNDVSDNHHAVDIMATDTQTPSSKYPHRRIEIKNNQIIQYRFVPSNKSGGTAGAKQNTNVVSPPPTQTKQPATGTNTQTKQPTTGTNTQAPQKEQVAVPNPTKTTTATEFATRVVELTNAERKKNGLAALQMDTNLSKVAQEKSNDMERNNYFSHTSPTYGSPFDMMRDFGVTYKTAGENIAKGQTTPEQVVNSWMNSEGHRKNILSPNFTHLGVGHSTNHCWTQMFIGR